LIIKIELLGSYHDRIFNLNFNSVISYQLGIGKDGHCDLIAYEIYYEADNEHDILTFNAEFADGSAIIIEA
jgi:hypothetical protein